MTNCRNVPIRRPDLEPATLEELIEAHKFLCTSLEELANLVRELALLIVEDGKELTS
jgi:hypothetical protein